MSDLEISYKGNKIVDLSTSGTKTLNTKGKYCSDDITVVYTKSNSDVVKGYNWDDINEDGYPTTFSFVGDWRLIPSNFAYSQPTIFSGYLQYINKVIIPDSVTSIGVWAFKNFTGLETIIIPNKITSITTQMFNGCTSLTNVTIGNNVKSIDANAFAGCTSLTNITIPNSVTNIGNFAFYNCNNLTNITIENNITNIGTYAFYKCTNLTSVIHNGITYSKKSDFIANYNGTVDNSAFAGCTKFNV